ncbi:MAG: hypothetical protein Fur0032_17400 [Terrimicrobiaceae bacterium]
MAGEHSEEAWDEYQWERFLQQQDRRTEKYFGLLEQFSEHPDCDDLIAKEMGWEDGDGEEDEMAEGAVNALEEEDEEGGTFDEEFEEFTRSPVYVDTLRLHTWVNRWADRFPDQRENSEAVRMVAACAVCGAKLAAALCGNDGHEPGMTIAYLKRALHSAHEALDAAVNLSDSGDMKARDLAAFRKRLFPVREHLVDLMAHYRGEWMRRNGGGAGPVE